LFRRVNGDWELIDQRGGMFTNAILRLPKIASGDYAFAVGTTGAANQTIIPGAKCFIVVAFTPSRTGDRDGTVSIFDNAQDSPSSIDLDGTGK
jgi:hypothetical protein